MRLPHRQGIPERSGFPSVSTHPTPPFPFTPFTALCVWYVTDRKPGGGGLQEKTSFKFSNVESFAFFILFFF